MLGCRSRKPHRPQKLWYLRPRLDSVSGMYAIVLLAFLSALRDTFRDRAVLQLELLALRHQLATLERTSPRLSLRSADRLLWVILSRILPNWREVLVIVKPETVVGWHPIGFRLFWTWRSRRGRGGRPAVLRAVRDLIRRMSRENPLWGAPRIHGELKKLERFRFGRNRSRPRMQPAGRPARRRGP
jgi:hypothetical protein